MRPFSATIPQVGSRSIQYCSKPSRSEVDFCMISRRRTGLSTSSRSWVLGFFLLLSVVVFFGHFTALLRAQEVPGLRGIRDTRGLLLLSSTGADNRMHVLEHSQNLKEWSEAARTLGGFESFPAPDPTRTEGFYRIRSRALEASDDWKNQVHLPDDAFLTGSGDAAGGGFRWVKFTLRLDKPGLVYFQDSGRQPFHYGFIRSRLPDFQGMSPQEIDAVSLSTNGQRLVLGTVLLPLDASFREVGLQILGQEPIPMSRVVDWLTQVRSAMALPTGWSVQYVPTLEQGSLTMTDQNLLDGAGFPVAPLSRWIRQDEVYARGWAHGRIRAVPSAEIRNAFITGKLRPDDILLTDAVPAEIPVLAGVITTSPATPNSHVAILSQSFGIPFVHVSDTNRQAELHSWDGQEVILVAGPEAGSDLIRTLNVEGFLTPTQRSLLANAKTPVRLSVTPMERLGRIHASVEDLLPRDIRHVGGKAANFATLRRSVPNHVPRPSLAFTFDLWMDFLEQVLPDGRTLRSALAERLKGHSYPPDMIRLASDLAAIRSLIKDTCDFSESQKRSILDALKPLQPRGKLRFRSSTNVEDSEQFTGAGLYDSYSGCLLDDLDGDTDGPSLCDPSEPAERGVFRALRRVFASFYNDNAVLERLRHGVNETSVGMAVLVHPSFPDEIEWANGVATLQVTNAGSSASMAYQGELVLQPGAESVANPDPRAQPEVVTIRKAAGSAAVFQLSRRANRIPRGDTVLEWTQGYSALAELLESAAVEFARVRPAQGQHRIDVEFKKVAPGILVLKQIREIPSNPSSSRPPPFVLSEAAAFEVFQHHGKELFSNHRLKSIWRFPNLVFAGESSGSSGSGLDVLVDLTYHDGQAIRRRSGRIGSFPQAKITASDKTVTYQWVWTEGDLKGAYKVTASFPTAPISGRPVVWADALQVDLSCLYDSNQPLFDPNGNVKTVKSEKTRLVPLSRITTGSLARQRQIDSGSIRIAMDYSLALLKFGHPGIGIYDTKSYPLVRWYGTTLTGLTSEPFRLTGAFSQTYDSIRHNFSETFLFEPGLDPEVSPGILAELRAANVRRIRVDLGFFEGGTVWIQGWDGKLRRAR